MGTAAWAAAASRVGRRAVTATAITARGASRVASLRGRATARMADVSEDMRCLFQLERSRRASSTGHHIGALHANQASPLGGSILPIASFAPSLEGPALFDM